ncbi:MAG: hypothetical protein A3F43_03710 [Gammaproteobacteria bacterium RIFCSPHIGHO2_12_FULL_42_10]|nr:MAG: hypothetical protein A3F43_03710 [Gammaproteobacteria bacterium RIFCSPHIGHO2_12_FULL_42_10]
MITVDKFLSRSLQKDATAIIFQKEKTSFRELDIFSSYFASQLLSSNLNKNSRIAIFAYNSLALVISYLAIFKTGATVVPVNTRFKSSELAFVLKDCEISHLIIDEKLKPIFDTIKEQFGKITIFDIADALNTPHSFALPEANVNDNDIACILYTSGTTSKPKGVIHTNQSLFNTVINQIETLQYNNNDHVLVSLPMCHIAGFAGQMLTTLYVGGCLNLIEHYDPRTILHVLARYPVTHLMLIPYQISELLDVSESENVSLSSIKVCLAGGDKIPLELHRRFYQLTGKNISECCGMTESFSYAIHYPVTPTKLGSIGKAAHGTQIKIINSNNTNAKLKETGEILVKSRANAIGYWNNQLATTALLANGWLHTGDLAYRDEDGYYWFMGRKKEIIIRGGSNIAPQEVEDIIYLHHAVKEAGVFGYPDKKFGQIVYAFVVTKSDRAVSEADLRQFIMQYLANYKVPERIFFARELPHNSLGKLERHKLEKLID